MAKRRDRRPHDPWPEGVDDLRTSSPNGRTQQKGAQRHAEGQHGPKTHARLIAQLEAGPPREPAEVRVERKREEAAYEGRRRLVEDRQQHDEGEKNSERTRLFVEHKRGRDDGPSDNTGSLHGVLGHREHRADYKLRGPDGLPVSDRARRAARVATGAPGRYTELVNLPSRETVPALGQGTWHLAEDPRRRADEIAALRAGLDLGVTLIDTAEMYADGAAEQLVADAIAGRRDEVFLVSKVLPSNASRRGTVAACERSLERLRTDRLDLYLLHWRGRIPLQQTLDAFDVLASTGKIRYWGVSNLDVDDMLELVDLPGGGAVTTDQVFYNLAHRGIEWDLLPWCRERRIPVMAYSPIEQGRLLAHPRLRDVAARHDATPAQIALAWVLRHPDLIAIPKASSPAHVHENRAALDIRLTDDDLAALDRAFPPPRGPVPLEML